MSALPLPLTAPGHPACILREGHIKVIRTAKGAAKRDRDGAERLAERRFKAVCLGPIGAGKVSANGVALRDVVAEARIEVTKKNVASPRDGGRHAWLDALRSWADGLVSPTE